MRSLPRSLVIVAALSLGAAVLPACGGTSPSDDGGMTSGTDGGTTNGTDAGTNSGTDAGTNSGTDGGFVAGQIHHMSYVPADERPTSAVRLIAMGDSITAGYGASQPSLDYASLLLQNDDSKYPKESNTTLSALFNSSSIAMVNVAVPGATSGDMASSQPAALTQQLGSTVSGHSIVVITIGGNDFLSVLQSSYQPPRSAFQPVITQAVANVRKVVTFLQNTAQFKDGVSIYLANLYDPTDGSGVLQGSCLGFPGASEMDPDAVGAIQDLSDAYVQLGTQMDFAVVDDMGHFHGHGIYGAQMMDNDYYDPMDPTTWLYTDCIHPNDPGHNEMRRVFFEAIDYGHYTASED